MAATDDPIDIGGPGPSATASAAPAPAQLAALPRRVLASPGGAWFAWGFIGGVLFAGAAVYVIRKRL